MARLLEFILVFLLALSTTANAVPGECTANGTADCPADKKYCNTFNDECEDCCNYDNASCPPGDCDATEPTECRNVVGVACGLTIPEVPKKERNWLLPVLGGLAVTISYGVSRKLVKRKPES